MKICPHCSEGAFASSPGPGRQEARARFLAAPMHGGDVTACPTCGRELTKSNDPHLGRTIAARYRLIKRLGTGGMSSVYLAQHMVIERLSAIKILRRDLGLNPEHRERFLREARAVNRINHENIVEITDFGESDALTYLVMEYVEGQTLLWHLRQSAFPIARASRIALQIGNALARAHHAGVIHRDLKPENVLLVPRDGTDIVKLTDFGIAKIVDAPAITYGEHLFGTPGYIAPEYVETGAISPRSDLYSLGVVLYEMLTGKLPFEAKGQAELLLSPLSKAPIPPGQRVVGLPPELEALVLRMLARRPEDRPHDAFAVCDVLKDVLRRFAGGSVPPVVSFERDEAPTMHDTSSRPPIAEARAEAAAAPGHEASSRWHAALADLNGAITRARKQGGHDAEIAAGCAMLVQQAAEIVPRLERAARQAGDLQAKVDLLEATGREFRVSFGRAMDVLVHDRSREIAHLEALRGAGMHDEESRASAVVDDLSFQIRSLEAQLAGKNEDHERALVEAVGTLQGALSAVRVLRAEVTRLIDEASTMLAGVR